ncbi:unnamed protein product [Nesidiocoris tenuis]|uniref:Alkyl transferase n=1 Tax=Nesidiocoris tenuis TaxID=355587 RepID=A0A6H5GY62_9HEMI|nr:unnamed protein product [Nesidiocoris tenuis]CAB0009144.1 unnamed protein product [Nesidiocoris tenuis]
MSSWISDSTLPWHSILMLRILKCGRIPKHIAFIMDGNRRFAQKSNIEKIEGHSKGFDKLSEVLQWCLEIGVEEVTVYAFSIENFKRSKEEVDGLMDLTREKFNRLLEEKEKMKKHGLRVRVIGNKSLLSNDLAKLAAEAELMTRDNNQSLLNVAFSYTSQDEIANACNIAVQGLIDGRLENEDIDVPFMSKCLYTQDSPFPEIIIRTSGETRLSDFLLWQGCASYLHFTGVLWPELTVTDFLWAIFKYQRVAEEIDVLHKKLLSRDLTSPRQEKFIENVEAERWSTLERTLAAGD